MKAGAVAAVIADDTILLPEANTAANCELHIVQEQIEEYDLALAFRRTFDEPALLDSINLQLLYLLQNGSLEVRTCSSCVDVDAFTAPHRNVACIEVSISRARLQPLSQSTLVCIRAHASA